MQSMLTNKFTFPLPAAHNPVALCFNTRPREGVALAIVQVIIKMADNITLFKLVIWEAHWLHLWREYIHSCYIWIPFHYYKIIWSHIFRT